MTQVHVLSTDPDVRLLLLERPYVLKSPFDSHEFAMLLVACDPELTNDERDALADAVVAENCRYACCAGIDCSRWDYAIDVAFLATDKDFDPPESRHVMTTWHEEEPLADTVFFFFNCTSFDHFVPRHFLIVFVGDNPETRVEILAHVASELGG